MLLLQSLSDLLGVPPAEVAARLGVDAGMGDLALAQEVCRQAQEVRRRQAHACDAINGDVARALGVAPGADLAAVMQRIGQLRCNVLSLGVRHVLGLTPHASDDAVLNAIGGLRAAHAARQTTHQAAEAADLVDQAIADGRVAPAHREFYLHQAMDDPAAARDVINSLPTIHAGGMGKRSGRGADDAAC
jgi:hypothetical protein